MISPSLLTKTLYLLSNHIRLLPFTSLGTFAIFCIWMLEGNKEKLKRELNDPQERKVAVSSILEIPLGACNQRPERKKESLYQPFLCRISNSTFWHPVGARNFPLDHSGPGPYLYRSSLFSDTWSAYQAHIGNSAQLISKYNENLDLLISCFLCNFWGCYLLY